MKKQSWWERGGRFERRFFERDGLALVCRVSSVWLIILEVFALKLFKFYLNYVQIFGYRIVKGYYSLERIQLQCFWVIDSLSWCLVGQKVLCGHIKLAV